MAQLSMPSDRSITESNLTVATPPHFNANAACPVFSLPVELWEAYLLPRCQKQDIIALSMTCKDLRFSLLGHVFSDIEVHFWDDELDHGGLNHESGFRRFSAELSALLDSHGPRHMRSLALTSHALSPPVAGSQRLDAKCLDLALPIIQRFIRLRTLTFRSVGLTESHVRSLLALHDLQSLSLLDCWFDLHGSALPHNSSQIRSLTLEVDVRYLAIFLLSVANPSLESIVLNFAPDFTDLERLPPFEGVKVLHLCIDGLPDPISFIARLFPGAEELKLTAHRIEPAIRPALPPMALPALTQLSTQDLAVLDWALEAHLLRTLSLVLYPGASTPGIITIDEFLDLLSRYDGTLRANLRSMTLDVVFQTPDSIPRVLRDVSSHCIGLEDITFATWGREASWQNAHERLKYVAQALRQVALPLRLRTLCLAFPCYMYAVACSEEQWIEQCSEVLRSLATYKDLEYVRISLGHGGPLGTPYTVVFHRDVQGPLSVGNCHKQYSTSDNWTIT